MWGGLCCRAGCNKRKQTAGFFSEKPKKESENISHVAQDMRFLWRTRRLVCKLLPEASGGELTGQVWPFKRSVQWNCVKFHRLAKTPTFFKLLQIHSRRSSKSLWRIILCSPQGPEDIWYLGSEVNTPSWLSLLLFRILCYCENCGIIRNHRFASIYLNRWTWSSISFHHSRNKSLALYSGTCMWHVCWPGSGLCLINCMNGPPRHWEMALPLPSPISHIKWGLMGRFSWKLGHWFIDWASDRARTGEMSVFFRTRPSEWCRRSLSNSDKESEMWQLTTQGVKREAFVIPKVSHSPRKRR